MAQLILETGADTLDPILAAVTSLIGGGGCRMEILKAEATEDLQYVAFEGSLPALAALFQDNAITSAMIRPGEGRWWITLFRPMFDPEGVPWWSMTVEYRVSEYQQAFETLRRVPGLRFVSVASEEGLEFDATPVNPGTFPWKHFRLIRAAVRDDTGRWVDKSGPASTMQQ